MKYRWIIALLCVVATCRAAAIVEAAPKVAKNVALSQTQKDLLHNAFGAINIDSDLEDEDLEAEVRAALNTGISTNARDEYGDTLLLQAVENGRVSVVRMLLRRGANPNQKSLQWKETPLRRVLRNTSANDDADARAIFRMLLQRGANVNERDENGLTSLMLAASDGHDKIVEMLLKFGANYRLKNRWGETALQMARAPIYLGQVASAIYPAIPPTVEDIKAAMVANYRLNYSDNPKIMGEPSENYERVEAEQTRKGRIRIIRLLRAAGAKE